MSSASRPLDGLLVVSVEQAVAAPMCTSRLADAGARVIKIERAEGETARHYDRAVNGVSAYFAWLNRGKQSIVLDLKAPDDLALARRMIASADVFVQNLAPGATRRLGLGAEALVAQHPRLIALDIVGYASQSDCSDMRAYDMLIQAESGLCSVTGSAADPAKVGVSVADICTGLNAHAAILEALLSRGRTGAGRAIEIAMFDGMAEWMSVPLLHYEHLGRVTPRTGLSHASIFPYGAYPCADGREVVIVVQNPGEWSRFCSGFLRQPELIADPRFADNPARVANRAALEAIIRDVLAGLSREAAIDRLEESRLAWSRVSSLSDLSAHPALRRITAPLADGSSFEAVAPPLHPDLQPGPPPELDQHGALVRAEFGV